MKFLSLIKKAGLYFIFLSFFFYIIIPSGLTVDLTSLFYANFYVFTIVIALYIFCYSTSKVALPLGLVLSKSGASKNSLMHQLFYLIELTGLFSTLIIFINYFFISVMGGHVTVSNIVFYILNLFLVLLYIGLLYFSAGLNTNRVLVTRLLIIFISISVLLFSRIIPSRFWFNSVLIYGNPSDKAKLISYICHYLFYYSALAFYFIRKVRKVEL